MDAWAEVFERFTRCEDLGLVDDILLFIEDLRPENTSVCVAWVFFTFLFNFSMIAASEGEFEMLVPKLLAVFIRFVSMIG